MSSEVLILAAGTGERWDAPYPKHLSQIAGVPLIRRTIEQLDGHGIRPRVVTTNTELTAFLTRNDLADIWPPLAHRWTVETLLSTKMLWQDTTIVLLGDVVFSGEDLAKVLAPQDWITTYSNARIGEMFAIRFREWHNERVAKSCEAVIQKAAAGDSRGKLWEWFYHIRQKGEVRALRLLNTVDVDTVEDWRKVNENIANRQNLVSPRPRAESNRGSKGREQSR